MSLCSLRPCAVLRFILPISFGLCLAILTGRNGHASEKTFVLETSGYGIDDCLAGNTACGKLVADAWCSAHGLTKAVAFGSADDVTGAIADQAGRRAPEDSVVVRCRD